MPGFQLELKADFLFSLPSALQALGGTVMRIQFDAQAIDLRAADLECMVSLNVRRQFASTHAHYASRGSLGSVGRGMKPSKHDGHLPTSVPLTGSLINTGLCRLPLLGLSELWQEMPRLGQDAITG
jgi:hypothetical protein